MSTTSTDLGFRQVDVFSDVPFRGNPVAVVHGADALSQEQMQAFAAWTNLSETTFLLHPTAPDADYRVRIFTPDEELPFAGHPTLGSAHAWLEAGGVPRGEHLVQQCEVGLVTVRRGRQLAFAAPALLRSGPATAQERAGVLRALRLDEDQVLAVEWVDNGPGWVGVRLRDARSVLDVRPDPEALGDWRIGLVGEHGTGHECAVEVRAFMGTPQGIVEDPVTGSLNASLAQWLIGAGALPNSYVAAQGTALGRRGRVHVQSVDGEVWIGGATVTRVRGVVSPA